MKLYHRENYLKNIRGFYHETDLIKVITGIRRCGKSCLMQSIAEELIASGVKEEKRVCICGNGGAVSFMDRSTLYNRELFDKTFEVAKEKNILCQPKSLVAGGNDAGAIHKSRGGVKTLTVSVPCRYLHSPGCVIKYSDAVETLKLVSAMAEEFAKW